MASAKALLCETKQNESRVDHGFCDQEHERGITIMPLNLYLL